MQSSILCIAALLLGDAICSSAKNALPSILMEVENGSLEDEFSFQRGHFSTSMIMGGRVTVPTPPHLILLSLFDVPTSTSPAKFEGRRKGDIRIPPLASHMAWDVERVGSPPDPPGCCQSQQRWTRGRR